MPPTRLPGVDAAAPRTPEDDASTLRAVRALLAEEPDHAARLPAPSDAEWRFLLVLYEATLDGRALTPAEAAEAAAVPAQLAPAIATNLASQHFLEPTGQGEPLRLTDRARDHLALWIDALTPLAELTPDRATAAAPPPARRPGPRASRW